MRVWRNSRRMAQFRATREQVGARLILLDSDCRHAIGQVITAVADMADVALLHTAEAQIAIRSVTVTSTSSTSSTAAAAQQARVCALTDYLSEQQQHVQGVISQRIWQGYNQCAYHMATMAYDRLRCKRLLADEDAEQAHMLNQSADVASAADPAVFEHHDDRAASKQLIPLKTCDVSGRPVTAVDQVAARSEAVLTHASSLHTQQLTSAACMQGFSSKSADHLQAGDEYHTARSEAGQSDGTCETEESLSALLMSTLQGFTSLKSETSHPARPKTATACATTAGAPMLKHDGTSSAAMIKPVSPVRGAHASKVRLISEHICLLVLYLVTHLQRCCRHT